MQFDFAEKFFYTDHHDDDIRGVENESFIVGLFDVFFFLLDIDVKNLLQQSEWLPRKSDTLREGIALKHVFDTKEDLAPLEVHGY